MSALDQAIIKAYAKDKSASSPAGSAAVLHRPATESAAQPDGGASIERTYHEGLLYRTSVPARIASESSVPRPHLLNPPPTSPRRGVRRSLLRKLAAAPPAPSVAAPTEPPPRVARKVIIRHVSHAAPPSPLGLSRSTGNTTGNLPGNLPGNLTSNLPGNRAEPSRPVIELPPETAVPPTAPIEAPAPTPAAPPFAPLNVAWPVTPQIEVHCDWHDAAALAASAVLVESRPAQADRPWQMVAVELEALAAIELAAANRASLTTDAQGPAAAPANLAVSPPIETVDNSPQDKASRPQFRLDAPHASGRQRPHVRFFPPPESRAAEDAPPLNSGDEPASNVEGPQPTVAHQEGAPARESSPELAPREYALEATLETACEDAVATPPLTVEEIFAEELTLAEPLIEPEIVAEPSLDLPLASDLIPHERDDDWLLDEPSTAALAADAARAAVENRPATRPAVPQWEVDSFQWPRTCQKLMADEHGYLARAGDRLLAASQDGLRVLAISGSRRGEGRTTLALCLARAAAKSGLQTAVMDCDFARPQLASKIGLEAAHGWQDAALGNIPLSEAAVKSLADNITVLPLESAAAARKVSLADPRVTATIRAAAATFDLLILDLGPLAAGETLAFPPGEKCPLDAAIVVRDLRFSTTTESEAVGHILQDAGVEAVGIAENFVIEDEIPATSV